MGAYISSQLFTTGNCPHMMLSGNGKALPLKFFYPEYEGKRTWREDMARRDVIRRQQESYVDS